MKTPSQLETKKYLRKKMLRESYCNRWIEPNCKFVLPPLEIVKFPYTLFSIWHVNFFSFSWFQILFSHYKKPGPTFLLTLSPAPIFSQLPPHFRCTCPRTRSRCWSRRWDNRTAPSQCSSPADKSWLVSGKLSKKLKISWDLFPNCLPSSLQI